MPPETKNKVGRKSMGMTNVPVGFPKDLKQKIKAYADKYCEGNFNMAVRQLCLKAL